MDAHVLEAVVFPSSAHLISWGRQQIPTSLFLSWDPWRSPHAHAEPSWWKSARTNHVSSEVKALDRSLPKRATQVLGLLSDPVPPLPLDHDPLVVGQHWDGLHANHVQLPSQLFSGRL